MHDEDVFRFNHRKLNAQELGWIREIKEQAAALLETIEQPFTEADQRSLAIAKRKLQESIMWAVHGVTA